VVLEADAVIIKINLCKQYIEGENGMLVDMRFMPRIVEGEIRILMVADKPIFVVHKKTVQEKDAFSATIAFGATYTYYKPEEFPELVDKFVSSIPMIVSLAIWIWVFKR